ncbi:uncharacterized protein LOC100571867 [Acyrthosiphon pisum]|uniref:Uncharacterized protein n=1 Tax=Acyrthosiphon pisum TaxID=7029 RepID=A0A8R1W509_ACYPI|nr:uncharacterized protein LOC100571867 [Acyrthosiphon pisum]|eukprot:XP_003243314.1 PREDICTED: uncharacterized protein LOC100571867 [Acyrthosiphon pisum]
MPSSKGKANRKDSTSNLLRLFHGGRTDHRVVTRQDLTTDYPDNDNSPRTSTSDGGVAINNYYTWNSSRTNSSIHKERAEIVSALHSVKSASELHHGLSTCNSFTGSHRLREIMSMCADRRGDFSTDEYHRHDHGNSGNDQADDVASTWSTSGATADRRSWSSSYIGGASRCWSCTATDRETDDDEDDDDYGNNNNLTADEANCRRTADSRRLSWVRKLNQKFRNSRDSR